MKAPSLLPERLFRDVDPRVAGGPYDVYRYVDLDHLKELLDVLHVHPDATVRHRLPDRPRRRGAVDQHPGHVCGQSTRAERIARSWRYVRRHAPVSYTHLTLPTIY